MNVYSKVGSIYLLCRYVVPLWQGSQDRGGFYGHKRSTICHKSEKKGNEKKNYVTMHGHRSFSPYYNFGVGYVSVISAQYFDLLEANHS